MTSYKRNYHPPGNGGSRAGRGMLLAPYGSLLARRLSEAGRTRTARAYLSAITSLEKFAGREVHLRDIDGRLVKRFEQHLISRGLKLNTISFYMRNLRAVYNRAVAGKLIPRKHDSPFSEVYTGVYESPKRALDRDEITRLAMLEKNIPQVPSREDELKARKLGDALYYFLFCYHSRGMSYVDMAHLKKSDLDCGRIRYRRRKTGGWLEVKVTRPMEKIISHFRDRTVNSEYLFPVIDPAKGNICRQYETGLCYQNRLLGELASLCGIPKKITTHVSRHTWATLAKRSKVDIQVISEALGHRDVKTTSRYLGAFEQSTIDNLSEMMSKIITPKKGIA